MGNNLAEAAKSAICWERGHPRPQARSSALTTYLFFSTSRVEVSLLSR
jgi:hypothetical protein